MKLAAQKIISGIALRVLFYTNLPWGMRFPDKRVEFCGVCWIWVETRQAFVELKILWLGPLCLAFGRVRRMEPAA